MIGDFGALISFIVLPAFTALVLFAVFTYLYRQSREAYFRAWQVAWGAYLLSFGFYLLRFTLNGGGWTLLGARLTFAATVFLIFKSVRMVDTDRFGWTGVDAMLASVLVGWNLLTLPAVLRGADASVQIGTVTLPADAEFGYAAILLYCAFRFLQGGKEKKSSGFVVLGFSLAFWGVLLVSRPFHSRIPASVAQLGHFLGSLPQMMIGIAMVMALYESNRRRIQENLIAFSRLEVDFNRVLGLEELAGSMANLAQRLAKLARTSACQIYILEPYRRLLPSGGHGFSEEWQQRLDAEVGQALGLLANFEPETGYANLFRVPVKLLRAQADPRLAQLAQSLLSEEMQAMWVLSLQAQKQQLGVVLLPTKKEESELGSSHKGLLTALNMQLSTTLEKYALLHEAQRKTQEFELLTEIGQAVSSHLEQEEVLKTIHHELGRIVDTTDFYVAFQEQGEIVFYFETGAGQRVAPRRRKVGNGLTEYIIRSAQPVLIQAEMDEYRRKLGLIPMGQRPAKCLCAVPIFVGGQSVGAMVALDYDREYAFTQRDVAIFQTAAGQLSVAMENARLFTEQQRRARYLEFLNSISNTAISSRDADRMMKEIVASIQQNFSYDHIGIGLVDYGAKEIEIKAEAGSTAQAKGKRIAIGTGTMGRVVRNNQIALAQSGEQPMGILPGSRSVLCIPLSYGEKLLGVLNVESKQENAFGQEEVLLLRTLADLLATALHNAFVFQRMEEQSITDALTGIKTRRFFGEALQSEWKRASRSGRAFSLVFIDLDKFKEVNDNLGHLEGDLVLARLAMLLEQKVRQSNVVARYGGDEFVILMPETGLEQAHVLSERLRLWIANDPMLDERHITASFGVASFPEHGATVEDIIRMADSAVYASKRAGGNRVCTVELTPEGVSRNRRRQIINSCIEGFLQRDHIPTSEEVITALNRVEEAVEGEDVRAVLFEAARSISHALELREVHSGGHGEAVASYAVAIGRELKMSPEELDDLALAAEVHDIGKITLPEKILSKQGPLTLEEYQQVREYSVAGARILSAIPNTGRIQEAVLHITERYDGGGYPKGLKGEEIPLSARVLSVAEAYVNMTNERPYAEPKTSTQAMTELERMCGTQFDGMVVRTLLQRLRGERTAMV